MKVNPTTGLTDEEEIVYTLLRAAANAYADLPVEHPSEPGEFTDAIHRGQDLLAARIARREYPEGWGV